MSREAVKNYLPVDGEAADNGPVDQRHRFCVVAGLDANRLQRDSNPLLAFRGDQDIYLLDLSKNNAVKKIVALAGPDSSPIFSPDGKQLAFQTALAQPYFYYANSHIAVVDLATVLNKTATTPADVRDLTGKFDEDPYPLEWGPDGIYFAGRAKDERRTCFVSIRKLARFTGSPLPRSLMMEDVSFTPDFKTVAFVTEDPTHMAELFRLSRGAISRRRS